MIDLSTLYHAVRIVQTKKVENGRLYLGGYGITYDTRTGEEISRTANTWHGSLGYDAAPRRSFMDWLLRVPPPKTMQQWADECCPDHEQPPTPAAE